MVKVIVAILTTITLGVTGYFGYQEYAEAKNQKKEEAVEEAVEKMEVKEEEVKSALKENIESIYRVLKNEEGSKSNKPALETIESKVEGYVTKGFVDEYLEEIINDYYCDCDSWIKPDLNYDVRFEYEIDEENILKVNALKPASEIDNMGYTWNFELENEEEKWKIKDWGFESLDSKDIQLTKEEVENILSASLGETEFIKEFESEEANGTAYLFRQREADFKLAISSSDTRYVYDFEEDTQESVEQSNEETSQVETEEAATASGSEEAVQTESTSEPVKETQSNNESRKQEYSEILAQTETKERNNQYQSDFQMRDDYGYNLKLWDVVLNDIYSVLKTQLSKYEMNDLKNEQRQWIKDRDNSAQKRYDEEGGGTLSQMVYAQTLFEITKERCYELVNNYMK